MAGAVNTCVHVVFRSLFLTDLQEFATGSFHFVIMGCCVSSDGENGEFGPFWSGAVT